MEDEKKSKVALIGSGINPLLVYAVAAAGMGEILNSYIPDRPRVSAFRLPNMIAGYSKYERHQGKKEIERRRKRLQKARESK